MKKKENILINGCSKGIGLDFFNYLSLSYNVFGLSSVKSKKKIFYTIILSMIQYLQTKILIN